MHYLIAKVLEDNTETFWEHFKVNIGDLSKKEVQEKLQNFIDEYDDLDIELKIVNIDDEDDAPIQSWN